MVAWQSTAIGHGSDRPAGEVNDHKVTCHDDTASILWPLSAIIGMADLRLSIH
jgi:hypothetical protein